MPKSSTQLVIVESPTKAKTLSGYLPKDFKVVASMGHIRDLPKSGLGIDTEHDFMPMYVVNEKSDKVLKEIKKIAKESETVVLATDPDREGEAISWHLRELLSDPKHKKETKFLRVVFHELTKEALQEAFEHPGDLNMNLVDSQQARRVIDRLVGYKLSPLLWKKVRYGLSAGRVQSVAVRLIVERERERDTFKPDEYWIIKGIFSQIDGNKTIQAELAQYNEKKITVDNTNDADRIHNELNNDSFIISSIKKSERKKNPYPPLKTSTLQQSMANIYGFNARRTMRSAQSLFEKGYITYHRTDSLNLSPQFISAVRNFVSKQLGAKYLPEKGIFYKTKSANAQEAHEAIRPTDVYRTPKTKIKLTSDEQKVYSVVWKRAIECQMLPAIYDQTGLEILSGKGYLFRASGSTVKFEGYLAIGMMLGIIEDDEQTNVLDNFNEQEKLKLKELIKDQKFTLPPARYNDASLIKTMEELGIGRPSTYAPTISTIETRGYALRDGRSFVPSDFAYVVTDLLVEHFPTIVDYQFTAKMEEDLDEVANGNKKWVPIIREFYEPFEKTVEIKDKQLKKTDVTNLGTSEEKCPECGKDLIFKLGKYGKFLSCSGYPDCKFAKPVETTIAENGDSPQDYGKCSNCETGVMILKQGKFGKFLACSNYPKCKTAKPFLDKIGMKCPKCHEWEVVMKKAKRRSFYGCSRYPECDWSSWKKPIEGMIYEDKTLDLSEKSLKTTEPKTRRAKKTLKKSRTKTKT